MDIIEIKNLSHNYPNQNKGLHDINLSIKKGAFVLIGGQNGSGKTTLLRHLNGLLLPKTGYIKIHGISVKDDPQKVRQLVGMVFQDTESQIVGETVYSDAAFGPENLCLDRKEINIRVSKALQSVGLLDLADHRPHLLSGGERRKLAIAGILAMNPKVLVFDEPFSNLDYPGTKQVLSQIVNLHKSGHTIVLTTHDLEKVITHADRLILMKDGTIVRDGEPLSLLKELEQLSVREPCESRVGMEIQSWLN